MTVANAELFEVLQARLRTMLPERYDPAEDEIQPVSMGSAGLKFKEDGTVAWDDIWGSFCHLAMAGGPPHRGMLLEPGTPDEIGREPGRYRQAAEEICRGIRLITRLESKPARSPGWVRVECTGAGMAGWLARAIAMENVSAHCDGAALFIPAGPAYRLEKQIKNVIVSVAKTRHYWSEHMPEDQRNAVTELLATMAVECPLMQPENLSHGSMAEALVEEAVHTIEQGTGLQVASRTYVGWLGVECGAIRTAIWMMRMLAASNVLTRREGTLLFVPVHSGLDRRAEEITRRLAAVHALAAEKGPL